MARIVYRQDWARRRFLMTVVSQYLAYQQQLESGGSSHYQFPWDLPSQTCPQSGDLVPDILVSWREVSSTDNRGQRHSET